VSKVPRNVCCTSHWQWQSQSQSQSAVAAGRAAVARTTEHGAEFAYSSFPSSASADHKTRSFPSSKYRFFLIREKSKLLLRICHVSSVSKGFCCTSQRQWQWQSLVNSRARDSSPTASLPTYLGISILAFTVEHYRIWLTLLYCSLKRDLLNQIVYIATPKALTTLKPWLPLLNCPESRPLVC
jgi:hypothetical protein